MKRKLLMLAAVLIMALTATLAIIACDNEPEHEHDWGDWFETTAASCTAPAIETRICQIDDTHIETRTGTSALGHNMEWITTTSPTCLTPGIETYMCRREGCIHRGETRSIDPIGHDWGDWIETTAATCTKAATEIRFCTNDSLHYQTQTGRAALGHSMAWVITTMPTCTTEGIESYICQREGCDSEELDETRTIDALGHDWVWDEASNQYICERCKTISETFQISASILSDAGYFEFDSGAFEDTANLTSISISPNNTHFVAFNEILFTINKTALVFASNHSSINSSYWKKCVISNTNLNSIIFYGL